MTGRELSEKLNYFGMVRGIRKLALDDKLATAEEIAVMTEQEVCELILAKYEVVYVESDQIGFMEKEKYAEYQQYLKEISR